MRVMVVDDEADVRTLFEQRFRKEVRAGKLTFRFATSGEEALELLDDRGETVALVLSDINMPGMSGIDLLKQVKQRYAGLKVIMITAYGEGEYARQAREYGCDGYLVKPLDFGALSKHLVG